MVVAGLWPKPRVGARRGRNSPRCAQKKCQMACKPGSVVAVLATDNHSSGMPVTGHLARPTRTASGEAARVYILADTTALCGPYSVLLLVGFAVPFPLPEMRCALTAPFHPYRPLLAGGPFSVALSLRSLSPDVIRHHLPLEPGLSSPAKQRRLSGHLANYYNIPINQRASELIVPPKPSCSRKITVISVR